MSHWGTLTCSIALRRTNKVKLISTLSATIPAPFYRSLAFIDLHRSWTFGLICKSATGKHRVTFSKQQFLLRQPFPVSQLQNACQSFVTQHVDFFLSFFLWKVWQKLFFLFKVTFPYICPRKRRHCSKDLISTPRQKRTVLGAYNHFALALTQKHGQQDQPPALVPRAEAHLKTLLRWVRTWLPLPSSNEMSLVRAG